MKRIHLLSKNIINQIAAGEVIQRPASAVKELIENSLDAESNKIDVIIKDAGKTLIQVIDNGTGIHKDDLSISCQRHATSKINTAKDLFNLKTMGFRGEALSSIASISHLEISTKTKDQEIGHKIRIKENEIIKEECVCQEGTSIKIKNIFFNVPARRRFLKSNAIETKHIIEEFVRVALATPKIEWKLIIDNKQIFRLDGVNLRQRIVQVIGKRSNEKIVPIQEETNLININGFIGKPEFSKKKRGEQYFFVNKRFIKNYYLNHAVVKAFEGLIPEKYYPSYFIYLEVDPKEIDVNIHPTKTEIKFENEQPIYSILKSSIKRSIGKYNIAPTLDFDFEPSLEIPLNQTPKRIKIPEIKVNKEYNPFHKEDNIYYEELDKVNTTKQSTIDINESTSTDYFQIYNRFIIANVKDQISIIHQQRAHERILFEHFMNKKQSTSSQELIFPQIVHLNLLEIEEIKNIKNKLDEIGFKFTIETNNITITATPIIFQESNLQELFEDFIGNIDPMHIQESIQEIISLHLSKSMSIKQGDSLTIDEIKMIVNKLTDCKNPFINPKGLKTFFNLSKENINKKFK